MIIFTKNDGTQFQSTFEMLSSPTSQVSLNPATTLILCEEGLRQSRSFSENYVRLLLHKDSDKATEVICGFIEAYKMAKGNL